MPPTIRQRLVTRLTLRLDRRLHALLSRKCGRGCDLGAFVRAVLAESVGRPDLADVNPPGRPAGFRPAKTAKPSANQANGANS
jgi:hypothetical protein